MSSQKRITKVPPPFLPIIAPQLTPPQELSDLTTTPPPGWLITLPSDSNLHIWALTLAGPPTSPFAGGTFHLALTLPPDYPFAPPTLSFKTKIYHPNVTNDDKGSMCLGLLRPDTWKPSSRVRDVLVFARGLLESPEVEGAVEGGIAAEVRGDRGGWERKAREWVERYAKG